MFLIWIPTHSELDPDHDLFRLKMEEGEHSRRPATPERQPEDNPVARRTRSGGGAQRTADVLSQVSSVVTRGDWNWASLMVGTL
jgi:hypothetical protein